MHQKGQFRRIVERTIVGGGDAFLFFLLPFIIFIPIVILVPLIFYCAVRMSLPMGSEYGLGVVMFAPWTLLMSAMGLRYVNHMQRRLPDLVTQIYKGITIAGVSPAVIFLLFLLFAVFGAANNLYHMWQMS